MLPCNSFLIGLFSHFLAERLEWFKYTQRYSQPKGSHMTQRCLLHRITYRSSALSPQRRTTEVARNRKIEQAFENLKKALQDVSWRWRKTARMSDTLIEARLWIKCLKKKITITKVKYSCNTYCVISWCAGL